jgi:hypothetical protein
MQAGYGAWCGRFDCAACVRPITPSISQLAAAGRPFCVSTDRLGHGTAAVSSGRNCAGVQRAGFGRTAMKQRHDAFGRDEDQRRGQDGDDEAFAAGQPVEDEARLRNIALYGQTGCVYPALLQLGQASGLAAICTLAGRRQMRWGGGRGRAESAERAREHSKQATAKNLAANQASLASSQQTFLFTFFPAHKGNCKYDRRSDFAASSQPGAVAGRGPVQLK